MIRHAPFIFATGFVLFRKAVNSRGAPAPHRPWADLWRGVQRAAEGSRAPPVAVEGPPPEKPPERPPLLRTRSRSKSFREADVERDRAVAARPAALGGVDTEGWHEPAVGLGSAPPRLFEAVLAVGFTGDSSSSGLHQAAVNPRGWGDIGKFKGDILGRFPGQDFDDGPFGRGSGGTGSEMALWFTNPSGQVFHTAPTAAPACALHAFVMTTASGARLYGHVISTAYRLSHAEFDVVEEMVRAREEVVRTRDGSGLDAEHSLLASRMRQARATKKRDRALWSRRALCLLSLCPYQQTFLWLLPAFASANPVPSDSAATICGGCVHG
jgi:hypothetical protein